jgi:GNAT superfamily N-acetyltransferase
VSEKDKLKVRAARPEDFSFCERTYFEPLQAMIAELGLDEVRRRTRFAERWQMNQVRIALRHGQMIGWLQTASDEGAVFIVQLFVDAALRGQGIGGHIVRMLIDEAAQQRKAVTLGVVKINPARRLYERLGFRVTHEDHSKFYMRRPLDLGANIRRAVPADITRIMTIRHTVHENRLSDPNSVTAVDCAAFIDRSEIWVWVEEGLIQGFGAGDVRDGWIWALFVAPGHEGRGIGRALLRRACETLRDSGNRVATLCTGEGTRAERFYRADGWTETGKNQKGELVFEKRL